MSKLDAYLRKHGHYPRKRIPCGRRDQLTITVAPGYALISTDLHGRRLYIPRSAMRELVRFLAKMDKHMGADFDVEQAMHESYEFERQHAAEMRQFKKGLYRPKRRRRR